MLKPDNLFRMAQIAPPTPSNMIRVKKDFRSFIVTSKYLVLYQISSGQSSGPCDIWFSPGQYILHMYMQDIVTRAVVYLE